MNHGPSLRHLEWPRQAKPLLKLDRRWGEAAGMEPHKDSDKAALHYLYIQWKTAGNNDLLVLKIFILWVDLPGAGESVQWIREVTALPEDPHSILAPKSQLTTICDSSTRGTNTLFWSPQAGMRMVYRYICRQKIHAHKIKSTYFKTDDLPWDS